MGRNQYWAGRVYDLCIYYMTGTPEGSTESGFMEKPGIEPATPDLQGIALIHYTTRASLFGRQVVIKILEHQSNHVNYVNLSIYRGEEFQVSMVWLKIHAQRSP